MSNPNYKSQKRKEYYLANRQRELETKREWRKKRDEKLAELMQRLGNLPDPTVGRTEIAPVYTCPHCGANLGTIAI